MIKSIIKSNGETQPFSADKINGWGEWASKRLGKYVDWSTIVMNTVKKCPEVCPSRTLQETLIRECLDQKSWSYYRMAGRLYVAMYYKDLFGVKKVNKTIKQVHESLIADGFMSRMDYSDKEYQELESVIDHSLDMNEPHYAIEQIRKKYSLRNRVTGKEYETPQFVYMRMAMSLAEDQPKHRRMTDLKKWYKYFSEKKINAPTPNYLNLGTPHRGFASCSILKANDNARSLAAHDHGVYTMTYMSAGIGSFIETRSIKDAIRGGAISHNGKLPYYRVVNASTHANTQGGRGGAATTYFSCYDPEVMDLIVLKNPMTTEDKKIRGIDYAMQYNTFFAKKVAQDKEIFLFNVNTAPDLQAAFFNDQELFEELYEKYENDDSFKKTYVRARDVIVGQLREAFETGRAYLCDVGEMNRHTPHLNTIYSSNLCLETALPTEGYDHIMDMYSEEDHGRGEIAMCSLGGILAANIVDDAEYEDVAYYTLLMIDKCIHRSHYEIKHVGVTAKSRMNAGVGMIGTAHYMAKNGYAYNTPEGIKALHDLAEKHSYFLIKASLRLAKELGNAPWMHKTKWPKGWLPIDTYKKNVDKIVPNVLNYDWETLRAEIIEQGGIRNSSLINHMPSESSSKASATTNGIYPIRALSMVKTDGDNVIRWAAPDAEKLAEKYTVVWNMTQHQVIDMYAVIQKFADQAISADEWYVLEGDTRVSTKSMIGTWLYMVKNGMKTRYYLNSKTSTSEDLLNSDASCTNCTL